MEVVSMSLGKSLPGNVVQYGPASGEGACHTLEEIPCPGMIDELDERSGNSFNKSHILTK